MKKLIVCLLVIFITFLYLVIPQNTFAQESSTFTIEPDQEHLDDAVRKVTISFPELTGKYKACLRNDLCIKNISIRTIVSENPKRALEMLIAGLKKDDVDTGALVDYEGSMVVCGDGTNALKTKCDPENSVWFHPGNFYLVTIFQEQGDKLINQGRGGFYVNHHPPKVIVTPKSETAPENFDVSVTYDKILKDGKLKNNNFQIVIEGPGYKEELCRPNDTPKENDTFAVTFPTDKWKNDNDNFVDNKPPTGLVSGKYIIKINEQINDGNSKLHSDDCQGGFTYFHYICNVDNKKPLKKCEEIPDPNESDLNKFLAMLDALNGGGKGVPLPCKGGPVTNPLECNALDTSIGTIALNPVGFITRVFSIVLSFAGIGALFLIIYSGYRLMISRNNKEVIQGARETLTAAIIGLIFIIASIVLLTVIAVDILKIPGFG
jgi:hypothetical protein